MHIGEEGLGLLSLFLKVSESRIKQLNEGKQQNLASKLPLVVCH